MISCGEPSGDLYAGALASEILRLDPSAQLTGFGGERLREAGVTLVGEFGGLSVTGLLEVARVLPRTYATYRRLVASALENRPDVLVAIDFPDFNFTLARALRKQGIPIVYYNIPSHTGTRLSVEQLAQLGDIPGLDYLKDTSGDAVGLAELLVAHSDRITAFNGWDTLTFFGIASGAKGSVWGVASIVPELAVELWDTLAVKADLAAAREQWKHLWAISDFLESVDYAAGIKAGPAIGHPAGPTRAPVRPRPAHEIERLTRILGTAGQVPLRRPRAPVPPPVPRSP